MAETNDKLTLSMEDLFKLAQGVGRGLEKKIFTKEEVQEIFPIWNKVLSYTESIIRKKKLEDLYQNDAKETGELPTIHENQTFEEQVTKEAELRDKLSPES